MKAKDIHSVLRRPLITEKTTAQKEDNNQVVFVVRKDANKVEIKRAVETLFDTAVTGVNTVRYRGKTKRIGRSTGRRVSWKKAIVTLASGQELEFFDEGLEGLDLDDDGPDGGEN